MNYFGKIKEIIFSYKNLGERITNATGAHLIGKAPHIAPEAWLHHLYPPLNDIEIKDLEKQIGIRFPDEFNDFLKLTNGLELFNTTLYIKGFRRNFIRDMEQVWQPFSIITPNTIERPDDAPKSFLFIGGYDYDGSSLCIDCKTHKVYHCKRWTAQILNEWNSFEEMLLSETKRLIKLFDKEGKEKDPEKPTTP